MLTYREIAKNLAKAKYYGEFELPLSSLLTPRIEEKFKKTLREEPIIQNIMRNLNVDEAFVWNKFLRTTVEFDSSYSSIGYYYIDAFADCVNLDSEEEAKIVIQGLDIDSVIEGLNGNIPKNFQSVDFIAALLHESTHILYGFFNMKPEEAVKKTPNRSDQLWNWVELNHLSYIFPRKDKASSYSYYSSQDEFYAFFQEIDYLLNDLNWDRD